MMRVYLLDDEPGVRGLLHHFLDQIDQVEVVGENGSPLDAIAQINGLKPDVLFLDIEMPKLNGFQVLPYLKTHPLIIFLTAYDQYAVSAFEVNALDYVLKPPTLDRIKQSLSRARDRWKTLEQLDLSDENRARLTKVVCELGENRLIIWVKQVALFTKYGRYTSVLTWEGRQLITSLTTDYLNDHLNNPLFFRANRAEIVNKRNVLSFNTLANGQLQLTLRFGDRIKVSRRRTKMFRQWLEREEPESP